MNGKRKAKSCLDVQTGRPTRRPTGRPTRRPTSKGMKNLWKVGKVGELILKVKS